MKRKFKGLLKSKTFWWNVFSVAAGVPVVLGGLLPTEAVSVIAAIGNVGLRIITTQPVDLK